MAVETVEATAGRAARRRLRPFVSEALAHPTGPRLLASLMTLMTRSDLSAREWVEVTAGWKRMGSFCDSGRLTAVAEVDRSLAPDAAAWGGPGRTDSVRPAADELAPALGIAPRAASALVALTRRLEALPAAADALCEGRMDYTQVRVLDRVVRDLPADAAGRVEAAAVRWAPRTTAQQLHADLAAEAMRADPSHASTAVARGVAERDVTWRPSRTPGCGRLVLDGPVVPGTAAWLAVNAAAKNAKRAGVRPDGTPEGRTLAQLRADVVTALLTGQGDPLGGRVPTPADLSALAEVQVVVAADTLAGSSALPAHLPGVGPVDVGTARRLARRSRWRRLSADPVTGALLGVGDPLAAPTAPAAAPPGTTAAPTGAVASGAPSAEDGALVALREESSPAASSAEDRAPVAPLRESLPGATLVTDPRWPLLMAWPAGGPPPTDARYRPTAGMRRHVRTRDATCVGPACHHPACVAELDHTLDYGEQGEDGTTGLTSADNLGSLCERMHNAKTHGGWSLRQPAPGSFVWTSPTGRVYERGVRPLVPGWGDGPARPTSTSAARPALTVASAGQARPPPTG